MLTTIAGALSIAPIPEVDSDFNGDGYSDILWRNPNTGVTWIQYLREGQIFGGKALSISIGAPWEAHTADFNNDNHPDILWRNKNTGVMWVQYLQFGDVIGGRAINFTLPTTSQIAPYERLSGDVVGQDSYGWDLLQHDPATGIITIHNLFGNDFVPNQGSVVEILSTTVPLGSKVATANATPDPESEIVVRDPSGLVTIHYKDSFGGQRQTITHTTSVGSPWELAVGEVSLASTSQTTFDNLAGATELIWRNPNTGVTWFQQFTVTGTPIGALTDVTVGRPWIFTEAQ